MVVTLKQVQASQMADPVKDGPSLWKDNRYRARCAPEVAVRASIGTDVLAVWSLDCGRKAQTT